MEFMSPAVPIDFISHELSLLSVYLGISLINLSFSLPLYILIFIQYYYTRSGNAVKAFLKNEGQQGVQRVASPLIFTQCVWVIRFDRLRDLNTTTLCLFTPFINLSAHTVYSISVRLSCHKPAQVPLLLLPIHSHISRMLGISVSLDWVLR